MGATSLENELSMYKRVLFATFRSPWITIGVVMLIDITVIFSNASLPIVTSDPLPSTTYAPSRHCTGMESGNGLGPHVNCGGVLGTELDGGVVGIV